MNILVCLGNVPDTTTKVKFNADKTAFDATGVQWVINPWDELALTRAVELKEDAGNEVKKVTVATVGGKMTEPTIRKALAIGADDAIRVDVESLDALEIAGQLKQVVEQGEYSIILCGIETSDQNRSAVGGMLAELCDMPSVSAVSGLEIQSSEISLTRDIDGGKEKVQIISPFVAIVQKGIAKEPRIPAMRGIMMARKKPLTVLDAAQAETTTKVQSYTLPEAKPPCKMIAEDAVQELVNLLQNEAKVL